MIRLTPSFPRLSLRIGAMIVFVSAIAYFWQGFQDGKWWGLGYILSFAMPLALMPIAGWYMFVPKVLEYSEDEFRISTLIGTGTYKWLDLDAYGPGENVFMIQFAGDQQAYQIASFAYPREEWNQYMAFLKSRLPERKARVWIGARLYRSRDR